jgi:hypothetical protein
MSAFILCLRFLEPFSPNRIGEVREREREYLFLVGVAMLVKQVTLAKTMYLY